MSQQVSVALCTFNGQNYIQEQLMSLVNQSVPPFEIVVCDDNSQDSTLTIVEEFSLTSPIPVKIHVNPVSLGVVKNFEKAISLCTGDYIALCDQDDIWLANKIEITLHSIQELEAEEGINTPVLAYTDLTVVDSTGEMIHPSFMQLQHLSHVTNNPLRTLIIQNLVTGCTVLINRALAQAALPIPAKAIMHDWWLALVAASCGRLIYIPQSTIYYRQHSANAVGAKRYYSAKNVKRILNVSALNKSIAATIDQAYLLRKQLNAKIDEHSRKLLDQHLKNVGRSGFFVTLGVIRMRISKQGLLRQIVFLLLLLSGTYKHYLSYPPESGQG